MSSHSDELHIRVELPSPTNHASPWPSPLNQLTKSSFLQNGTSEWTCRRDSILVSVATTNPNRLTDVDHEALSQKKLVSQQHAHRFARHTRGSDLSLEESDLDIDNERPQSPTGSFTDDDDEYDCKDLNRAAGDCALMGSHTTANIDPDGSIVTPSLTRPTRIRFRSRVRITSGLNRHRHSINTSVAGVESRTNTLRSTSGDGGYFYYTPSSSISGSPSSSISAPLRSRTDDEADRPGWGPLGQRVSLLAKKNRSRKKYGSNGIDPSWSKRNSAENYAAPRGRMTENSPLLAGASFGKAAPRMHHREWRQRRTCYCVDCGISSRSTLSPEEMDQTFGTWPTRLLNYQWWWWQAEKVICCRCLDETDDQYY